MHHLLQNCRVVQRVDIAHLIASELKLTREAAAVHLTDEGLQDGKEHFEFTAMSLGSPLDLLAQKRSESLIAMVNRERLKQKLSSKKQHVPMIAANTSAQKLLDFFTELTDCRKFSDRSF